MQSDKSNIRLGITGASGFIGRHLTAILAETAGVDIIPCPRQFWDDSAHLAAFADACDAIIHLAFVNRHPDPLFLYDTNVLLAKKLAAALKQSPHRPTVFYASSIREGEQTAYGRSKAACRTILEEAVLAYPGYMASLQLPNLFGPGAAPYDNSYIATFSHQLLTGRIPIVTEEREVPLRHVRSFCNELKNRILRHDFRTSGNFRIPIAPDFHLSVRQTLSVLEGFVAQWHARGRVDLPADAHLAQLREAFLSHTA